MKDILVEFTDYGAIVHKNPLVISSKKDLPYCFFNPDLSKVSGVSPSYWVYINEEIIPASPEEKKRRDEYHKGKPPENTVSLKQTMDLMRQEICEDTQESIKQFSDDILKSIDDVKGELYSINNEMNLRLDVKISELEDQLFEMEVSKEMLYLDISEKSKEIKHLKIGLVISVIISILLKLNF
jgi:hypothetical protein